VVLYIVDIKPLILLRLELKMHFSSKDSSGLCGKLSLVSIC